MLQEMEEKVLWLLVPSILNIIDLGSLLDSINMSLYGNKFSSKVH